VGPIAKGATLEVADEVKGLPAGTEGAAGYSINIEQLIKQTFGVTAINTTKSPSFRAVSETSWLFSSTFPAWINFCRSIDKFLDSTNSLIFSFTCKTFQEIIYQ
jgi:hypothetical protein